MPVTEGLIAVTEGSGKNLATVTVATGQGTVHREELVLADAETAAARAKVTNVAPGASDYGIAVRPIEPGPGNATVTRPPIGAGSTELLASNAARKRFVVWNEHSTQDLLVKEGGTGASATSYTYRVPPLSPFISPWPAFTGLLHAIFSGGATANVQVTEET